MNNLHEALCVVETAALVAAVFLLPATLPVTLAVLGASILVDSLLAWWGYSIDEDIDALDNGAQLIWSVDPSGYIYSGSDSNRLKGVKVTLYYKKTMKDEAQVWDANKYNQSNPTYSNSSGEYGWDVPEGFWQVKCELEGYETTYSEWLEVPPPQVNINIDMKKSGSTEVKVISGDANLDGIVSAVDVFVFKKYLLMKESFTPDQIKAADINQNGVVNTMDLVLLIQMMLG